MTAYNTEAPPTRKVDDLVRALGCDTRVYKSTVSRICVEIDEQVDVFRTRLDHLDFPDVFVDATYVKARVEHRIASCAFVVATGVVADRTVRFLSRESVRWDGQEREMTRATKWPLTSTSMRGRGRSSRVHEATASVYFHDPSGHILEILTYDER